METIGISFLIMAVIIKLAWWLSNDENEKN
jgi:hypothetical protein